MRATIIDPTIFLSLSLGLSLPTTTFYQVTKESIEASVGNVRVCEQHRAEPLHKLYRLMNDTRNGNVKDRRQQEGKMGAN
jgi:hypothetical protein